MIRQTASSWTDLWFACCSSCCCCWTSPCSSRMLAASACTVISAIHDRCAVKRWMIGAIRATTLMGWLGFARLPTLAANVDRVLAAHELAGEGSATRPEGCLETNLDQLRATLQPLHGPHCQALLGGGRYLCKAVDTLNQHMASAKTGLAEAAAAASPGQTLGAASSSPKASWHVWSRSASVATPANTPLHFWPIAPSDASILTAACVFGSFRAVTSRS